MVRVMVGVRVREMWLVRSVNHARGNNILHFLESPCCQHSVKTMGNNFNCMHLSASSPCITLGNSV